MPAGCGLPFTPAARTHARAGRCRCSVVCGNGAFVALYAEDVGVAARARAGAGRAGGAGSGSHGMLGAARHGRGAPRRPRNALRPDPAAVFFHIYLFRRRRREGRVTDPLTLFGAGAGGRGNGAGGAGALDRHWRVRL